MNHEQESNTIATYALIQEAINNTSNLVIQVFGFSLAAIISIILATIATVSIATKLSYIWFALLITVLSSIYISSQTTGDHHVVAAAIIAKADIIVTTNLKHFPTESLAPFGIKAQHPDIFLKQMYELFPDSRIQVIEQQSQDLKNPPLSVTELLDKLSRQVPEFVSKVWLTIQNVEN